MGALLVGSLCSYILWGGGEGHPHLSVVGYGYGYASQTLSLTLPIALRPMATHASNCYCLPLSDGVASCSLPIIKSSIQAQIRISIQQYSPTVRTCTREPEHSI